MRLKNLKLPKAIQHSAWGVIDAAAYPIVYLAVVPVMIESLGLVLFGVWMILTSLITILQLFNLNMSITAMRYVVFALGEENNLRTKDIINAILKVTAGLLLFVVLIGAALADVAVRFEWWGISKEIPGIALCVFLAAVFAGLKYFDQVFQSIFKAKAHFKLAAILNIVNRFGLLLITLILAVYNYPIHQILLANITFLCGYLLLQYYYVHELFPFYRFGLLSDKILYSKLLNFSLWPWLQALIVVLTFQTDRFWVSAFAGLSEVSGYGLVSTMFNHIHIIFTAMAIWLLPKLSGIVSRNEDPQYLYSKAKYGMLSFMLVSLLLFYYVSPYLLKLWLGPEAFFGIYIYVKPFVAFEMIFAYSILPIIYFNASGKEKKATFITLFYCALTYIFMLGGLYIFKSTVALVEGMLVAMCVAMPVVNLLTHKAMKSQSSGFIIAMEMITVYSAIALVYSHNIYLSIILLLLFTFMLWKFYLSGLIERTTWKPAVEI